MLTVEEHNDREAAWGDALNRFEGEASAITLAYLLAVRERLAEVIAEYTCQPSAEVFRQDAVDAVNSVLNCDRVTELVACRISGFSEDLQDRGLKELHRYMRMNFE